MHFDYSLGVNHAFNSTFRCSLSKLLPPCCEFMHVCRSNSTRTLATAWKTSKAITLPRERLLKLIQRRQNKASQSMNVEKGQEFQFPFAQPLKLSLLSCDRRIFNPPASPALKFFLLNKSISRLLSEEPSASHAPDMSKKFAFIRKTLSKRKKN